MTNKLLTVKELSEQIGYKPSYIRNLVYRGQIPYVKLSKRALRFEPDEIDRWVRERQEEQRETVSVATYAGPERRGAGLK